MDQMVEMTRGNLLPFWYQLQYRNKYGASSQVFFRETHN